MNEVIFYGLDRDNICETKYFDNIAEELNKYLSGYSIIFTADYTTLPMTKFKKIVILGADETGNAGLSPYAQYNDVVAVFRFYNIRGRYDNKYVFPIPTGYNCRSNDKTMIRMYPEKRMAERHYDIFYSGQILNNRKELVRRLDDLERYYVIYSQVNSSFRRGLDIDDYYRMLGDSKIVVCPDGTAIDTFRFIEACGSQCVVITTPKDDLWYYQDAPVLFIEDWSMLTESYVRDILSNTANERYQDLMGVYYEKHLSEKAVSSYIIQNVCNIS